MRILHLDTSDSWSTVVGTTEYLEKHPPKP